MKLKHLLLSTFIVVALFSTDIIAQNQVSASSSEASGSGGSASQVIGGQNYSAESTSAGTATSGVLHAYELEVLSVNHRKKIRVDLTAYPNPTSDYLKLKTENLNLKKAKYTLTDANGKQIRSEAIDIASTKIDVKELPAGFYQLHIYSKNKSLKTFKIIKQ